MTLLSASQRKRAQRRTIRRNNKHLIAQELLEALPNEEPSYPADEDDIEFYQFSEYEEAAHRRRRADIIAGTNPDTGASYTLEEFHAALEEIEPLTYEESDMAHSTAWNIMYYADLAEELRSEQHEDAGVPA